MKKLLVFGLDGASLPILRRYAVERPGGLFSRWLQEGCVRVLQSTLPFFTAPAWTTFMTGLEPGQHGMYHWRGRFNPVLGHRPLLSSTHLNEATIWWYCQQHGGRVSISNFPMQYPAPPTDGKYLCGTLAPEHVPDATWPIDLMKQVRAVIPDYRFEMDKGLSYMDRPVELRDEILKVGQGHARALEIPGMVDGMDLLVHVVTITDRMQHFFWHCFDSNNPGYPNAPRDQVGNPILDAYSLAEDCLETLWMRGDWDNVVILSDHGMGPSLFSFHTDVWLAENGYSQFNSEGRVDIRSSRVYSGEEPECSIYINKEKRDGIGVTEKEYPILVEEIRELLQQIKVPETGQTAFPKVFSQAELYRGRAAEQGPDLVLVPADGLHPRPGYAERVFGTSTRLYAGHRPEGMFIGYGADFQPLPPGGDTPTGSQSEIQPMSIQDLFPLLCTLMDLPIPSGLWGKIPEDIARLLQRESQYAPAWIWPEQVQGLPIPQGESPGLLARFEELGYL